MKGSGVTVTDFLVCVYYRVDASQRDAAIATVRDIQRGVATAGTVVRTELLLRSAHLPAGGDASDATSSGASSPKTADPTLMETYRLDARTTEPELEAFLARLAGLAMSLAPCLRGDRHVEVFRPCAS